MDSELAVVRLVASGLTSREVAERLFISRTPPADASATPSRSPESTPRAALTRIAAEHAR